MKKIIKINKLEKENTILTVEYSTYTTVGGQLIPYNRLFNEIILRNFITISEDLLNRLTMQYLHGCKITFETPKRNFKKTYLLKHPKEDFYSYTWKPLVLSEAIPKSLAEFKFTFGDKEITYLQAVQNKYITSAHYMPNEIWEALDDYSKQRIEKCKEYNRGNYADAEQWYKDLMHECIAHKMKMFSPNKKTYYEVTAEIEFEKCKEVLPEGLRPLNQEELCFLHKYAPAYGVEIPKFMWRYNTRKTDHGYTEEPERVYGGMSNTDWTRVIYDSRNDNNLPKNIRGNLRVQSMDNNKLIRDAYTQLVWLMKHMKDEALMPGYKRCPVCHEIYRESQGCECGACPGYDFIPADNLFYGDSSSYEDYDSTRETYSIMINEDSEDLLV